MTANEAATALGVSRSTLQRLLKDKELRPAVPKNPVLIRPRRLLFNPADVAALVARRKAAAEAEQE